MYVCLYVYIDNMISGDFFANGRIRVTCIVYIYTIFIYEVVFETHKYYVYIIIIIININKY